MVVIKTKAKVSQIYPVADPIKHTVVVKFDLPVNTVASPGMYAEVMIPLDDGSDEEKKINIIPISALLKGRSLPVYWSSMAKPQNYACCD